MNDNTLSDKIIAFLFSCRSTKIYYEILRERSIARSKRTVIQNTLYRLKKKGFIERDNGGWKLTKPGR